MRFTRRVGLVAGLLLVVAAPALAVDPTFRSANNVTTTTTGNSTVTEPLNCANGDALVALALADSGTSLTSPAGWTTPAGFGPTTQGTVMWVASYIIRSGAPSLTWSVTGASKYREIQVICLTNGATVAFDAASAAGTAGAAIVSPDPPSVTAVATTSLAVAGGVNFGASGAWTASTNYTLRSNNPGGGGADAALETRALVAAGAENPAVITMSAGSGDGWNGFTLTFKDGGGAAAPVCKRSLLGVGC